MGLDVGQAHANLDEVTLNVVVVVVEVVVDDEVVSVRKVSAEVLELSHVVWVSEDVIGMDSSQLLEALLLFGLNLH